MTVTAKHLFGSLFDSGKYSIVNNPDFKEASVRLQIINPILKEFGYEGQNIVEEKAVKIKTGSKKPATDIYADYALRVNNNFVCVVEAKAPDKSINDNIIEQAFSYAFHFEIRSAYFAICNGVEFHHYKTNIERMPLLRFNVADIEEYWEKLAMYLAPTSFLPENLLCFKNQTGLNAQQFDYVNRPLLDEIPVKKQAAKRHFGVHGYFTRQSWNVVQEYIKNYTKPDDLVLDPFGGSGITVVEALMTGRKGINIDLNPMAIFIVQSLISPVNLSEFAEVFNQIKEEYLKREPKTKEEIDKTLKKHKGCKVLPLPKGSEEPTTDLLFSDKQMAQLSLLKSIIKKQKNENIRNSLLLAFSSTVTRVNLTYHVSKVVKSGTGFGGDASAMRYYRYIIAPNPTNVDVMQCFEMRYKDICAAKKEMQYFINEDTIGNAQILKGTATDLSFIPQESVDYIYTDPPYGKKIPYLDLSVMRNAWLDLEVTEDDYKMDAIEGGEHNKTKDDYNKLIAQSIREMYRVLKFDRWLSFVFAHKDPEFWHLIIDAAESVGFEYAGAVAQKNGSSNYHKRQNPFTVLSGQLIINFRKVRNPRTILKANLGMNISEIVMQTIEGIIAKHNGATLEQINDELIIKGLELGFLDLLKKEYSDLTPILMHSFDYDAETELFTLRKNAKFTTRIPLELRIKYYLTSFLRRMEIENKTATFDEIVLHNLPLLKNGVTPENQTILNVLERLGERVGEGWRLKKGSKQGELF
ncbi:MAG: type I restriction enzyme HsdR N-terminal domain-containing protein [Dysgonamonadaceae bacterium]|nr:type I restriction enzyme HsdR N-terminal domain-containing protein [Dysgonamonadaceae bacterium]